jgi:hypothetical protein
MEAVPNMEELPDEPIVLIEVVRENEEDVLKLNPKAVEIIQQVIGHVAVVAVCGLYRTGKSSLLNWLLDRKAGFVVGPTVQACTRGIWIWGRPKEYVMPNGKKGHVLMLDTEGLGGVDANQQYDARIFSLATLLCSKLIYNSLGSVDENAISNLSFIANLTKHIRVSSSSENTEEDDTQIFQQFFPSFCWIIRDFALELEDEDGNEISPTEYLEKALAPQMGLSAEIMERNRVRQMLTAFFTERNCFTLVRPINDEQALQQVDHLDMEQLRPEFREQVADLKERVFGQLAPKMINKIPCNGAMFVELVKAYVEAINGGSVPTISTAWEAVTIQECRAAMSSALDTYKGEMEDKAGSESLPMDEEQLVGLHGKALEGALQVFEGRAVGDASSKFRAQLQERAQEAYEKCKAANLEASASACEALLQKLFNKLIQPKLTANSYANKLQDFQTDFAEMREKFLADAKGPQKYELLERFVESKMGDSLRLIVRNHEESYLHQLREKEAALSEAQEKVALQSGREETFKQMLEDAQRENTEMLANKTQLQAEGASQKGTIDTLHQEKQAAEEQLAQAQTELAALQTQHETVVKQKKEIDGKLALLNDGQGNVNPKGCCAVM